MGVFDVDSYASASPEFRRFSVLYLFPYRSRFFAGVFRVAEGRGRDFFGIPALGRALWVVYDHQFFFFFLVPLQEIKVNSQALISFTLGRYKDKFFVMSYQCMRGTSYSVDLGNMIER